MLPTDEKKETNQESAKKISGVNPDKEEIFNRINNLRQHLKNEQNDCGITQKQGGDLEINEEDDIPTFKKRKPPAASRVFTKQNQFGSDGRPSRERTRRDRSKSESRDRSISPFVIAMQNFDKFKKAEGAMLKNISSKKELYKKRPEDHPNYGDEWVVFWKKRYAELAAQGSDPQSHDFKADWIPHWEKRLSELFDAELLEKTENLLKKFDLTSVVPPKREDYERPEPSPPPPTRRKRTPSPARRRRSPYQQRRSSPSPKKYRRSSPSPRRKRRSLSRSRSRERRRSPSRERARHRSRSPDRDRSTRNPSPPGPRRDIGDRGLTGPSRMESLDLYSGITELENRRDRSSRSRSRESAGRGSMQRGLEFHMSDNDGSNDMTSVLRMLTALENSLGSLGPHVNNILAKVLSLEGRRPGASKVVLQDPDTVSILDMVKEKLQGQMLAGLLTGSKAAAVRISLDNLTRLLQGATKKRSQNLDKLLATSSQNATVSKSNLSSKEVNEMIASAIGRVLVATQRTHITDMGLANLVTELMKEVALMSDPDLAQAGKDFSDALEAEKRISEQMREQPRSNPSYSSQRDNYRRDYADAVDFGPDQALGGAAAAASTSGPAYVTPIYAPANTAAASRNGEQQQPPPDLELDDAEDFTLEELRSLLENFDSLSIQEQEDLTGYLNKLATTQPHKMKDLSPILKKAVGLPQALRDLCRYEPADEVQIINVERSQPQPNKEKVKPIKFSLGGGGGGSTGDKDKKSLGSNVFGDTRSDDEDQDDDCQVIEASSTTNVNASTNSSQRRPAMGGGAGGTPLRDEYQDAASYNPVGSVNLNQPPSLPEAGPAYPGAGGGVNYGRQPAGQSSYNTWEYGGW